MSVEEALSYTVPSETSDSFLPVLTFTVPSALATTVVLHLSSVSQLVPRIVAAL